MHCLICPSLTSSSQLQYMWVTWCSRLTIFPNLADSQCGQAGASPPCCGPGRTPFSSGGKGMQKVSELNLGVRGIGC